MDVSALIEKAKQYLPPGKMALVEEAYQFASNCHEGQMRKSGSPYLEHPLEVAMTVADLKLDAAALAAALLHDVTEDCKVPPSKLGAKFGPEVSNWLRVLLNLANCLGAAME